MGIRAELYKAYAHREGKNKALQFLANLFGLDDDIWRTTEEGKHFKFDNTTGEIKAGFGGRLNGKRLGQTFTQNPAGATRKPAAAKVKTSPIKPPAAQSGGAEKAKPQAMKPDEYTQIRKSAVFSSLAAKARSSSDYKSFIHGMTKAQRDAIVSQHKEIGTSEKLSDYAERLRLALAVEPPKVRPENKVVHGKDISEDYKWDGKSYTNPVNGQVIDTEIEDIIHKQGFDGAPKVVSQVEFNKILKDNPNIPILLRAYTAPNEETLAAYDEMLEGGQWYVDCGTGGAQYGQGMYCAGCYNREENIKKLADVKGGDLESGLVFSCENGIVFKTTESENHLPNSSFFMPGTNYLIYDHETGDKLVVSLNRYTDEYEDRITGKPIPQKKIDEILAKDEREIWDCATMPAVSREGAFIGAKREMKHYLSLGEERAYNHGAADEEPKGTVRVMALDPSSRIVTYNELLNIKDRIGDEGRIDSDVHEKIKKYVEEHPEAEMICNNYPIMSDFARENARETESGRKAVEFAESVWNERKERIRVAEMLRHVDDGVFAAMLGYDAINAEGHGESGSYTVVLNRTKVILSDQPADV